MLPRAALHLAIFAPARLKTEYLEVPHIKLRSNNIRIAEKTRGGNSVTFPSLKQESLARYCRIWQGCPEISILFLERWWCPDAGSGL